MDEKLKASDAQIVHILHDEVIVEAKADIADDVAKVVENCMLGAFNEIFPEAPFKVEPEIRDRWG